MASADSDDWLSPAKLSHLDIAGSITTVGGAVAQGTFHAGRRQAIWYGASAALVAGAAKELYDWRLGETRRFDFRDIALDALGAGLGVASAGMVEGRLLGEYRKPAARLMAATGTALLASTLLAGATVLAFEERDQRRDWYLPVGISGVAGLALAAGSRLAERRLPKRPQRPEAVRRPYIADR